MYTPETIVDGTVQDVVTAQLPQSIRPVGTALAPSFVHAGWTCGSRAVIGRSVTTFRAPSPL